MCPHALHHVRFGHLGYRVGACEARVCVGHHLGQRVFLALNPLVAAMQLVPLYYLRPVALPQMRALLWAHCRLIHFFPVQWMFLPTYRALSFADHGAPHVCAQ